MLKPSDLNYYDNDTIAKLSGQGWYPWSTIAQVEDLQSSYEITQKAIEKARNK